MNGTVVQLPIGEERRRARPPEESPASEAPDAPEPARTGRAWINGREVGGTEPALAHLAYGHD